MSEPAINLDELRGNARGGEYGTGQIVVMQLCDEVERLREEVNRLRQQTGLPPDAFELPHEDATE